MFRTSDQYEMAVLACFMEKIGTVQDHKPDGSVQVSYQFADSELAVGYLKRHASGELTVKSLDLTQNLEQVRRIYKNANR